MRLGAGQSSATLEILHIVRRVTTLSQANIWSRKQDMGNRQTVVGAFVLGGIILALGAIILFGQLNPFSRIVRAVVVLQGSASGLSIGAPVTFRGVPVGFGEQY